MQLADLFDLSLVGRRNRPALECCGADGEVASLSFGQLHALSNQLAHVLKRRGLTTGDRLAIHLPNGVEFIIAFLACARLGVMLVPINFLYRQREVAHIVGDAEPAAVVTTGAEAGLFPTGTVVWEVDALMAACASESDAALGRPLDGDTPALIVYTSGTTGRSKGAVLTHGNCMANALNLVTCWQITSDDRYLAVLPLFHVHGLGNGILSWLLSGCLMHLAERFDAGGIGALFDAFEPTLFFGVPTMYVRLLELPGEAAARIGRRARLFVCGSAPLPAHVLEAFRRRFGQVILERYGMSETLMTIGNPYVGERRPGSVGLPFPGVSTRIVDERGVPVGDGEVGELWVRGPTVFSGYWRRPDANDEAFRRDAGDPTGAAWFRTGDLAERAADGYYTLRGRQTDLIISGGFNIYPREIEGLLLELPGVRDAAVVGVPDEERDELPMAYVVADDRWDTEGLLAECRRELASFKVPRAIVRLEALPRTALGKVQKHLLPRVTLP